MLKKFAGLGFFLFQDAFTRSKKEADGKTYVPIPIRYNRVFTAQQESEIGDYTIKLARMFYGLPAREFRRVVFNYAEALGSKTIPDAWKRERMATRDWYYAYMARHPNLALKVPEGMSIKRAMAFNRANVKLFFDTYAEVLARHNFQASRIFNLDESGLSTVMKPSRVVCEKGRPVASQISQERGQHMTFVGIISADGNSLPPVFIINRKRMHAEFLRGTLPQTTILTGNGWMTHDTFVQTLQHFHERTLSSVDSKVLLIMDNAECHMSIHAVEYAIRHGIVIVTLPPHTTAKLQPLDVGMYAPFKAYLKQLQDDYKLLNPHVGITEHVLPEMACKAWKKVCTMSNITSAWAATGIYPVDRNIFPDEAFAGAEVSEEPEPLADDGDDLPALDQVVDASSTFDSPEAGPSGIVQSQPSTPGPSSSNISGNIPETPSPVHDPSASGE